jgi:uncharacterized protein
MILDITFFAVAIPAVLFSGISKGGFGSGAGFAVTPVLALILEPAQAVGLMLPLLMLMDASGLVAYWRQWDARAARALVLGAIPGILIGAAVYGYANPDVFRFMIGLVAVAYVVFRITLARGWIPPAKRPLSARAGMMAGVAAGFTSFVSHAGGPPASIYLLSQKFSKTMYQSTTLAAFWAINVMKFVPYAILGFFSKETLVADMYLAPFAFIGVACGVFFHRHVSERVFFALTYVFLAVTGTKLIWDALT